MEMKCETHGWVDVHSFCHKCVAEKDARIAQLGAALERIRKGGLRHRWKEIEAVAAAALEGK
jgi:hypothetical protein